MKQLRRMSSSRRRPWRRPGLRGARGGCRRRRRGWRGGSRCSRRDCGRAARPAWRACPWRSSSRRPRESPRTRRGTARRLQPDAGDAEVAVGEEGADPAGMALGVLQHPLPGAVGGEVVGDQQLILEGRLLGESAVEGLADPLDVIVGEDEELASEPRSFRRPGRFPGPSKTSSPIATRLPSAKSRPPPPAPRAAGQTLTVVWKPGTAASAAGKSLATSGRTRLTGARQISSPPQKNPPPSPGRRSRPANR